MHDNLNCYIILNIFYRIIIFRGVNRLYCVMLYLFKIIFLDGLLN